MIGSLNRFRSQCPRQGIAHLPSAPVLLPTFLRALPKSFSTEAELREAIARKKKVVTTLENRLQFSSKDEKTRHEWNNAKSLSEEVKAAISELSSRIKSLEKINDDLKAVIENLIKGKLVAIYPIYPTRQHFQVGLEKRVPPSLDSLKNAHDRIGALPACMQNKWRLELLAQMLKNDTICQEHNFVGAVISSLHSQQDKDSVVQQFLYENSTDSMVYTLLPFVSGPVRIETMRQLLEVVAEPANCTLTATVHKNLFALLSKQEIAEVITSLSWRGWI
ncbi:MAG: hypothetical protein WCG14_00045 [Chlamydiia bacterium]